MKPEFPAAIPTFSLLALAVQSALASTLPAPAPRVVVSAGSAWGAAADAWVGDTGNLKTGMPSTVKDGGASTFCPAEWGGQAVRKDVH